MKQKNDDHCFQTILPTLRDFFEKTLLTDLCFVCSDGNIFSYRLIFASISNFVKGKKIYSLTLKELHNFLEELLGLVKITVQCNREELQG